MIGICEVLLDDSSLQEVHRKLVAKSLRSGEILLDIVGMVLVSSHLISYLKERSLKSLFDLLGYG